MIANRRVSGVGEDGHGLRRCRAELLGLGALAVACLEAGDATASVEDLLLARIEGVAGVAHIDAELVAFVGGTGLELVAASARDLTAW